MNIIYHAVFVNGKVIHAIIENKRLLDQVRDRLRLNNYAYRTEKSYLYWITQYILFHNKRHPNEWGGLEIAAATIINTHVLNRRPNAVCNLLEYQSPPCPISTSPSFAH